MLGVSPANASTLPASLNDLPEVIEQALVQFHTPGMSVGVVKDNQVVYLQGHGLRSIEDRLPVTPETYFRLASVSKAFTATGIALLAESGDLNWQQRVTDHLAHFQMADPWVTREFTVLDLLTHRSGLASGAGDSMLWPEPSGFSREEIIHNLRYLTPKTSFRSAYAYNNVMYITAGEVIASTTGEKYQDFIDKHIFAPLGMHCFAGDVPPSALVNHAVSFGFSEQRGQYAIPRNQIRQQGLVSAAAGGLTCNAKEMLKWLSMWLNGGKLPDGKAFLSSDSIEFMWSPQTLLPISDIDRAWDETQFSAYGIGWRLADVLGHKVISHTGTLSGYQTYVTLVPELNLGVVLLNNGSNYGARGAVMQTILKAYMGKPKPPAAENWISAYSALQQHNKVLSQEREIELAGSGHVVLELPQYAGEFEDQWFGAFRIKYASQKLTIESEKMPMLSGFLEPFDDHRFVIRWHNPNAADDAMILFDVSPQRTVTGFTLAPFKATVPEYHEYSDMYFKPVAGNNTSAE
ncbi:serine hydrolase [Alteromonas aestuariivivens]|uniref:Serine hydrolase n=2 Tax=Alteromonas aestuariivivens TaxID=1938339 RepID=A0A3D8MF16_9ALTE|nr:serine hydrolase [Alteromonas aestuariivivens]